MLDACNHRDQVPPDWHWEPTCTAGTLSLTPMVPLCFHTLPHPADSTNPTWDWLTDVASDVPQWAAGQATVAFESAQAVFGVSQPLSVTLSARGWAPDSPKWRRHMATGRLCNRCRKTLGWLMLLKAAP